ncbi:MAG: sigma-70 family RNA polymerase sigma factor [Clostridia bacterium]|nr:sigma-70 family RNA polymerase sigma factor [Clostridia bacterium]
MRQTEDDRDRVVDLYAKTVWRIALARTRREDTAEEVFQEVFLRLFRKERSFDSEEHRKAWIIRTTLNCCRSYFAAAMKSDTVSLEELGDTLAVPEEKKGALEALLRLPAKYRVPLQLYYIEGMSAEECARVLKLRPGTFRVRISRGKEMLRELLKGEGIYV